MNQAATPSARHRRPASAPQGWQRWLDGRLAAVEEHAQRIACGHEAFHALAHYMLSTPGKRLRPRLALSWYAACASPLTEPEVIVRGAAALELMHEASLIHDDICDRGLVRRGVPSMAQAFGVRRAALFGYYLAVRAADDMGRTLTAALGSRWDKDLVIPALVDIPPGPVEGQLLETLPGAADIEAERLDYEARCVGKTGLLFMAACELGVVLAAGSTRDSEARCQARRFGRHLGHAFQILDDVLDLEAAARLARPPGADLGAGVLSWPVLDWAARCARPEEALGRLRAARESAEALQALREEILASGVCQRARHRALHELTSATHNLPDTDAPAVSELRGLIRWLEAQ